MAFADVVANLVAYLGPIMAPVQVAGRIPNPRPVEFIRVRRAGGQPVEPVREMVRVDVMAWAASDPRATELGNEARTAIWLLSGTDLLGPAVYDVSEFLSARLDDDPDTGTPRSWSTYDLTIRANAIIQPTPTI